MNLLAEREETMALGGTSSDIVSKIARIGAPVLVLVLLVARIASGHWWSVAFFALMFAVVIGIHFLLFAGQDDSADEEAKSR